MQPLFHVNNSSAKLDTLSTNNDDFFLHKNLLMKS